MHNLIFNTWKIVLYRTFFSSRFFIFIKNLTLSFNRSELTAIVDGTLQSLWSFFLSFSWFFNYIQATEHFGYKLALAKSTLLINIFYNCDKHKYLTLFIIYKFKLKSNLILKRICESQEIFFYNFWWTERESSEMHGFFFYNKSDLRNLMLEYFVFYFPLDKKFPSIGLYEFFYSVLLGFMIHTILSHQI